MTIHFATSGFKTICLRLAISGVVSIVIAACASSGKTTEHRTDCVLADRDSVFIRGGPIYRDCAVDRTARLTNTVHADYRPSTPRPGCYAADIEFVVDTTGKIETGTARVVRANDTQFAESVIASLPAWKYEPANRDGKLVRQLVSSHQSISAVLVRVPEGSLPPSGRPGGQRPPSC
jgi:hypothetical protein